MDEITIEKVENGYLVNIEDRADMSMRSFVFSTYSEVLNHLNGLEDESVKEDIPMVNIYHTGFEDLPITGKFHEMLSDSQIRDYNRTLTLKDKSIGRIQLKIDELAQMCYDAGLSIDQVIKLK